MRKVIHNMYKIQLVIIIFVLNVFIFNSVEAAFNINTLQYNGEEAIDVVFIADGFTSAEESIYTNRVNQSVTYLFDNPPFDLNQNKFNIYSIPTASNESGISVLGSTTVDSIFGTYLNRDNLPRFTGLPESSRAVIRNELKKIFKKKIYLIMILNTQTYGGSGDLNSKDRFIGMSQATLDGEYNAFRELLIHEFGHSFGDLADEYGGTCTDEGRLNYWDPVLFDKDNVTYDDINDRKWDSLVASPQYYLGANYCDNEWYRSSSTGLMRSLYSGAEHNELGQILLQNRIDEDITYNSNLITTQEDGKVSFSKDSDMNIRIHADENTLTKDLVCNNLYVAEDSNLIVQAGVDINCDSQTILGSISYQTSRDSRKYFIRYGCKDTRAVNYTRFARHRQSMCVYDNQSVRPPHNPEFLLHSH